jgi:Family of unknown function (DUF6281)
MMTGRHATAALCLVVGALVACGGGSETEGVSGEGSCALVVHFRGHTYGGISLKVAPVEGKPLGSVVLPGCADTGPSKTTTGEHIQVARLPSVSPRIALVWRGRPDTVLVRKGLRALPTEVIRLLDAPRCDAGDAPISLGGQWLGILGADGNTEVDLVPPYDVSLFVQDASSQRYLRAFLDVRVPFDLGRPLTRQDVRSSLWKGGNITVVATCRGRHYIAERIQASPAA